MGMDTINRSIAMSGKGSCMQQVPLVLLRHFSARVRGGTGVIHECVSDVSSVCDFPKPAAVSGEIGMI